MSFWESKVIKCARKDHLCECCRRTIKAGESYTKEAGTYDGEFQHYCLCDRCRWFLDTQKDCEDELGCLTDDLWGYDLVTCPSCNSINLRTYDMAADKMSMKCECDDCDEKWTADLSVDGLKYAMSLR